MTPHVIEIKNPTQTEWLTAQEVAKLLYVEPRQVGKYIDAGLKASRVGKRWLIDRADLDAFVRSRVTK
jgi:excisionase family DNA binding protein